MTRLVAAFTVLATPVAAAAQSAGQPASQGSDPVTAALLWMQSILLGPIATALAVMAVAGVGFMMLTGRMNWRYGATVIIGVFIIFGAPRLVATIGGGVA
ncbi:MAG: TrbC/VirB2 family protein [Erythrobacter sp.]|nr:TrbC/VirB2 family protein [Erythrobacter sp.]